MQNQEGDIVSPNSMTCPCMWPTCLFWGSMWGAADWGARPVHPRLSTRADAWPIHPSKRLHLHGHFCPSDMGHPLGDCSKSLQQCLPQLTHPSHHQMPPPAMRPLGQNLSPEFPSTCPLLLLQCAGAHV